MQNKFTLVFTWSMSPGQTWPSLQAGQWWRLAQGVEASSNSYDTRSPGIVPLRSCVAAGIRESPCGSPLAPMTDALAIHGLEIIDLVASHPEGIRLG